MKIINTRRLHSAQLLKLILCIAVTLGAGFLGSLFTTPAIQSGWYEGIVKPALNPPSWIFGPVWTILFILMGIAVWLVWMQGFEKPAVKRALILFDVQLILNVLWSIIFFGSTQLTVYDLNNIGIALVEIVILWLAILVTIIAFAKVSRPAAWLLVPYILWVTFATYLNLSIWLIN